MQKLKITYEKIDALKPYEKNAKEHPPEQIEQIVNSIKAFGFNDPIAVDDDFIIIEGHGRLLAAQAMDLKEVPIIKLGHMSEDEKRAYILIHNKATMNSGFNLDLLQEELMHINSSDLDLELAGFSIEDLHTLDDIDDINDDLYDTGADMEDEKAITLKVTFDNEEQKVNLKEELLSRGFAC